MIIIDDYARTACARRQARGHDPTIILRVHTVWHPGPGSEPEVVWVGWAAHSRPQQKHDLVPCALAGVVLLVDARMLHYVMEHELTVTAWRLGPWAHLLVVDDSLILRELQAWERRRHSVVSQEPERSA